MVLPRYLKHSIFASWVLSMVMAVALGWVFGVGWISTSVLPRLIVKPKKLGGFREAIEHQVQVLLPVGHE